MKNKKNQPLRTITHSDGITYSEKEYTAKIIKEYMEAHDEFATYKFLKDHYKKVSEESCIF